jgi:hypothetical protein
LEAKFLGVQGKTGIYTFRPEMAIRNPLLKGPVFIKDSGEDCRERCDDETVTPFLMTDGLTRVRRPMMRCIGVAFVESMAGLSPVCAGSKG